MHRHSSVNDGHGAIDGIENRGDIVPLLTWRLLDLKTDRTIEQYGKQEAWGHRLFGLHPRIAIGERLH